jgi:hypothetical protein
LYLRPEQVCKPFKYGGLDVKDLNTQGWLLPTDQNMPWQGLDGLGVLEFFLVSSFSFFESLIPAVCSLGSNFVKHFCRLYKSGTRFAYSQKQMYMDDLNHRGGLKTVMNDSLNSHVLHSSFQPS